MNLDSEISSALVSLGDAEKTLRAVAHRMKADEDKAGKKTWSDPVYGFATKLGRLESAIGDLVRLTQDIETLDESREERVERLARERMAKLERADAA